MADQAEAHQAGTLATPRSITWPRPGYGLLRADCQIMYVCTIRQIGPGHLFEGTNIVKFGADLPDALWPGTADARREITSVESDNE